MKRPSLILPKGMSLQKRRLERFATLQRICLLLPGWSLVSSCASGSPTTACLVYSRTTSISLWMAAKDVVP